MIFEAILRCPYCQADFLEAMPENTCQYQTTCPHCQHVLVTKSGECCVFCSYADTVCPMIQITGGACCG